MGFLKRISTSGVVGELVKPGTDLAKAGGLSASTPQVPRDIVGLLWWIDGPYQNYTRKPKWESSSAFDGITLTMTFFGPDEPSSISVKLPVARPGGPGAVERLGYYPSYNEMSPQQRWIYLNWLTNIDMPIDIGYVFTFYYGLERHLFCGQADQAVDMILRLREHITNKSFLQYSSNAIIAAALVADRRDWLGKFGATMSVAGDVSMSDIYLYAKLLYELPLAPAEIVALASKVGFTNRRYIKEEPALFEKAVEKVLAERFGERGLILSSYPTKGCPASGTALFANYSLDRDRDLLAVPAITSLPNFTGDVRALLADAHENVKQTLKVSRAASKTSD